MLKRYLLFQGDVYYPSYGWNDFQGSFDTIHEATVKAMEKHESFRWYQVVDTTTVTVVEFLETKG